MSSLLESRVLLRGTDVLPEVQHWYLGAEVDIKVKLMGDSAYCTSCTLIRKRN